MSSLLSLVESRLSAEIEDITSLMLEQRLQSRAVAVRSSTFFSFRPSQFQTISQDHVQQKWSAFDVTLAATQNVTSYLTYLL
jgi:hypothetical protein